MALTHGDVARSSTTQPDRDDEAGIVDVMSYYRRRIEAGRLWTYLAAAFLAAGSIWLLAGLGSLAGLPLPVLTLGLLALVLLPGLALILAIARRPSLSETASIIDSRLDNQQRALTSLELLTRENARPLDGVQIGTTVAYLYRVDPNAVCPVRKPWAVFGIATGLVVLALGIYLLRGAGGSPQLLTVADLPPDEQVASALASPTAAPGLPGSERAPDLPPIVQSAGGGPGQSTQTATAGQGTSQAQTGQGTDPNQQAAASNQAQSSLDRLTQALSEQSVTQGAADSLRQGKYDDAANQLGELGKQNDQLSDTAKQGLAQSLERAANDTSSDPILQKAEQDAADALRSGDFGNTSAALQNLGDALKQTAQNVVPQQELARNFPQQNQDQSPTQQSSSDPQNNQQQSSQNGQIGQEGQNGQNGQGNQSSQSGDQQGQQGQQQGQQGGGPGDQTGDQGQGQQTDQSGQSGGGSQNTEGEGQGGAPGQGTRVNGPSDSTSLNVPGNPFELESKPDAGSTRPTDNRNRPGITLDGGAGSASGPSPVQPGSAGTTPSESNQLPVNRWEVIQKYFTPDK